MKDPKYKKRSGKIQKPLKNNLKTIVKIKKRRKKQDQFAGTANRRPKS